ncbi:MAG: YggS family pyridoxal phosphate-dependent enzyme [Desulfobulbaceae bacterium]|nr:YggS family pyridoxal phosphate-dependent enzyme [Desulfobulbaceae bacterium]
MICDNLRHIRDRIHKAALAAGRDPKSIRLVAVSKHIAPETISTAMSCGQLLFGENYLQEAQKKIALLGQTASWHFIGGLQSNKAKLVVELFDMVETVDRLKTARALNTHAERINKKLDILVQVNIGKEPQKSGVFPENIIEFIKELNTLQSLRVQGLMAIPPYSPDPETTRSHFARLRELGTRCRKAGMFHSDERCELSMGMSGDFETAIEEGATIVRVGTAIFGPRYHTETEHP